MTHLSRLACRVAVLLPAALLVAIVETAPRIHW
jgi:hypothetical protein